MTLKLDAHLQQPDRFYEALIAAHDRLSKAESDAFNARLILLLANHIGDFETLMQALRVASGRDGPPKSDGQRAFLL